MELPVLKQDGTQTGRTVQLDASVFGIEPNDHVLWLEVRATQANMRQGTHKVKERSENTHSTRKLYRQKGTGGARAGDAKSPTRKGGGTIFGPRPRDYSQSINKKTKQLARRSAFSYKVKEDALRIVDGFMFDAPSTKSAIAMAKAFEVDTRKILILTDSINRTLYLSTKNVQSITVREAKDVSTLDVMNADVVLLQESALAVLSELLGTQEIAA